MEIKLNLIKLDFDDDDFQIIRNIRKKVFSDELKIPQSELFDKNDETCDHFILFDGKNVVGTIRFRSIHNTIKLERMAILSAYRTKNYGKCSILQLIDYYRTRDYRIMFLDSIYSVKDFYKKCGFVEEGEIFQRVGMDHVRMSLRM